MVNLPEKLKNKIQLRKESNLFRTLDLCSKDIDFYSNDYLGFASKKSIHQDAVELLESEVYCNGSTGSRLISGTHALHLKAEKELAECHQAEAALLYNSGYDANLGLFSSILQKGDVLLYDEFLHASCRDGIILSNAKAYKFKHNCLKDLEVKIQRFKEVCLGVMYIAVESIYSMDGDQAPLRELVVLCKKHEIRLIVDEAHSCGVYGESGQGLISCLGLQKDVFIRVHTFGKALGCHGAVVLSAQDVKDYLINYSKSFIYTTAISLHSVAVILSSYLELKNNNYDKLIQERIHFFKDSVKENSLKSFFIESNSTIQCCLIPGNGNVKQVERSLKKKGYLVKAVLSPTVPENKERIRICLHLFNSKNQINLLLQELRLLLNLT